MPSHIIGLPAAEIERRLQKVADLAIVHEATQDENNTNYLKVELDRTIEEGTEFKFKAPPSDCKNITALSVSCKSASGSKEYRFNFTDAKGNIIKGNIIGDTTDNNDNVISKENILFANNAVVKVVLANIPETLNDFGSAFVQNADTNKYIEDKFASIEADIDSNAKNIEKNAEAIQDNAKAIQESTEDLTEAIKSKAEELAKAIESGLTNHTHSADDIKFENDETLSTGLLPIVPINKGGTGATDAATARTNLGITPANIGAAASSHGKHVPDPGEVGAAKEASMFLHMNNEWAQITPALIGAAEADHGHNGVYAAYNHGNHVPATQTADNKKFLRNDNTWQDVTPANIGAAAASHGTHVSYGTKTEALGTASAGKESTVSRSDHVHALPSLDACSGTLSVEKGGTGATDPATARANIGASPSLYACVRSSSGWTSLDLVAEGTDTQKYPNRANGKFKLNLDTFVSKNGDFKLQGHSSGSGLIMPQDGKVLVFGSVYHDIAKRTSETEMENLQFRVSYISTIVLQGTTEISAIMVATDADSAASTPPVIVDVRKDDVLYLIARNAYKGAGCFPNNSATGLTVVYL